MDLKQDVSNKPNMQNIHRDFTVYESIKFKLNCPTSTFIDMPQTASENYVEPNLIYYFAFALHPGDLKPSGYVGTSNDNEVKDAG